MKLHAYALLTSLLAAVLLLTGCPSSGSPSMPDAALSAPTQPEPAKLGLNVNLVNEIGTHLAEIGVTQWNKTAADSPSSQDAGTTETAIGVIGPGPLVIPISLVQFVPAAALTQGDTNNATINVFKRTGGATQTLLAKASTFTVADGGTGSWTAWVPVTIPIVAGCYVSPGDVITISITKNGSTGVSVPQGELNMFTTIR